MIPSGRSQDVFTQLGSIRDVDMQKVEQALIDDDNMDTYDAEPGAESDADTAVLQNNDIGLEDDVMSRVERGEYYDKIGDKEVMYACLESLEKDLSVLITEKQPETCYFIAYRINCNARIPFLEIGMVKDDERNILHCIKHTQLDLFPVDDCNRMKGYTMHKDHAFIFYHIDADERGMGMIKHAFPSLTFVLMDEMVNKGHVYHYTIQSEIADFFKSRSEFSFLHSYQYDVYETPMVAYTHARYCQLKYTEDLGTSMSDENAPLGSAYYFTSYENAESYFQAKEGEYLNPAFDVSVMKTTSDFISTRQNATICCRFAVFAGKTRVFLNHPDDDPDMSDYKKERMKNHKYRARERMTLRITDHASKWKECYNTAYLGNVELDNGELYTEGPIWAVGDYWQQHYLDFAFTDPQLLSDEPCFRNAA